MPSLSPAAIGDAVVSDRSWETLERLVAIRDRMAGHEGETAAAETLEAAFEQAGLGPVQTEPVDIPGWWRGSSSVSVDGDAAWSADHHVIALPGTPAGTVDGPIVDVGYGLPDRIGEEVEGGIVVSRSDSPPEHRWVHRMETYASAAEAGAVGFVFRNHLDGQLPPTGEVGYHDRPGPIPAVGVSKELGTRLVRLAEREGGSTAELAVDCRHEPATSVNTSAAVGEGDREVLVTAHIDAHDIAEGAEDNGVGCALLPEIGRLLATVEDELDARVRLIAFGAEEIGLWGAYHHAASADLDRVKCVLNVDGAGSSPDPRVRTNGFEEVAAPIADAAGRFGASLEANHDVSPHGDSWPFAERGVPAVTVGSVRDADGRGWGHTHADTLDKLDRRDLRLLGATFAEAAARLADDEHSFDRVDPEAVRSSLAAGYVRELEVGGRWHFA